jgi:putative molybdopterin biosynthesis protein
VIGFGSWREGLVLRPDLAGRISGSGGVAEGGLRLVNRQPGAEARSLLDRALAGAGIEGRLLPGYDTIAAGHLNVASAIAAGLADAGIASEPAARAYHLGFIPLAAEHFDLVIPAAHTAAREVQGLRKALSSAWLHDQLACLPGYDPGRCGEPIATLPRRHRAGVSPAGEPRTPASKDQPSPDDR